MNIKPDEVWNLPSISNISPRYEWISVEEGLPEDTENKLLLNINSEWGGLDMYNLGWWEATSSMWIHMSFKKDNQSIYMKVTHWMPLPVPPI